MHPYQGSLMPYGRLTRIRPYVLVLGCALLPKASWGLNEARVVVQVGERGAGCGIVLDVAQLIVVRQSLCVCLGKDRKQLVK